MSSTLFQLFYSNNVAAATALLSRDGLQTTTNTIGPAKDCSGPRLSKGEINKRDARGRTVLHLAASAGNLEFMKALLENPATDINLLDVESGWSALHRALYNGRIACARYIIANRGRETIKAKDRESNSPFDVLNSTLNGTNPPPLYHSKGGSDLFTFGSNKNNTLGFGDSDDRSHPERVQITRPRKNDESPLSTFRPSRIRDVQMAKMHTAILTTDPKDNLYVCGFNGNCGRLGLSAGQLSQTQFLPKPVLGIHDPVASVALGQDHTIAITKTGAVYSWGSNQHGQLGYILDPATNKDNVQRVPRKITTLKRVEVVGIAASSLHSVCFSAEDLYTWGLNRGQLGYPSSDDGPIQSIPKKVAPLPSPVEMVTAIDNATICLLKTKIVLIFANGGYFRVTVPLDRFADNFAGVTLSSVFRPRQMYAPNIITKITSGGTTVCAVSSMGDVFSFSLSESTAHLKPVQLGRAIKATRIWSLRRRHMAVRDVAVGQDGAVMICTESGSVWTRIRRPKPKIANGQGPKEYKFARVGQLTRIVAVRANNSGAYAAIRNDVELKDIEIEKSRLEGDLISAIPLGEAVDLLRGDEMSADSDDSEGGSQMAVKPNLDGVDRPWREWFGEMAPPSESCDMVFVGLDCRRIYLHRAILSCRSAVFREFLQNPETKAFKVDIVDRIMEVHLDAEVVAIAQLVHYLYTDKLIELMEYKDNHKPERVEMINQLRALATMFRLNNLTDSLASSWYYAVNAPVKSLRSHLNVMQCLRSNLATSDAILCLADREVPCHSFILAVRCPFFQTMLDNSGLEGCWTASRRQQAIAEGASDFRIQLRHISYGTMSLVLKHIYCDTGIELFEHIRKETSDQFLEFVIEIMAVANELLLDRLKDICQSILAQFVTLRNVVTILEEADTYNAEQLKDACLDYCVENAEALLENRVLDDLDPDVMMDLEFRLREKQVERLPISKGEVLLHDLVSRYPNLEDDILQEHEARQFVAHLGISLASSLGTTSGPSTPTESKHPVPKSSMERKTRKSDTPAISSPNLHPSTSDLIFDMDDDLDVTYASPSMKYVNPVEKNPWRDVNGRPLKEQPPNFSPGQRFRVSSDLNGDRRWSEVRTSTKGKKEIGPKATEINPRQPVSQATLVRPSPARLASAKHPPVEPLAPPNPSTLAASPWKKPQTTPPISFKSLQRGQSNQMLSLTFPPSTQTSLPNRPAQPKTPVSGPSFPQSTSTTPPIVPKKSTTTSSASTSTQIRSVPGKSFQQQKSVSTSPIIPDMFLALGSSPQSLADIIAQQTSEQAAQSAKVAPRSLKDIQEEEQFLQWWEQESQRVQEEQLLAQMPNRDGRGRGGRCGTRGRGLGRGRGRGRGRGESGPGQLQK